MKSKSGWRTPGSKECANSKRPGHHRSFWQQNRNSRVLRICFSFARRSVLILEMKKPKTKSRSEAKTRPTARNSEQNVPYRKPALRSEAFARALIDAKACLNDSETLLALFNDAAKKAAAVPKEPFKEYWAYLQTMLRLVRAHHRGEYNQIPDNALLWIVAALNYLIDPFDLIPDATPILGFVDDATVIEFVADKARQTLDDFMMWETTPR